jgi:adenosylhomocysteine nucleosidase
MKLGILGAMREEVGLLSEHLEDVRETTAGGRAYREGRLFGQPVVLAFSRWGKVAAATTATHLIVSHRVDALLFTGVAGGVDPALRIGDVVVAHRLFQHDLDASPLFPPMEVPLLGISGFPADPSLTERLEAAVRAFLTEDFPHLVPPDVRRDFGLEAPQVTRGDVASGDQFFAHGDALAGLRRRLPSARCVEMEGAAVAQVCHEYGVPLALVRTLSDAADAHAPLDFQRFIVRVASAYSLGIVRRFLAGQPPP